MERSGWIRDGVWRQNRQRDGGLAVKGDGEKTEGLDRGGERR